MTTVGKRRAAANFTRAAGRPGTEERVLEALRMLVSLAERSSRAVA
jgi:hypothetical protein